MNNEAQLSQDTTRDAICRSALAPVRFEFGPVFIYFFWSMLTHADIVCTCFVQNF